MFIQIITILVILQIGFNFLFKPKYSRLNCGLFGAGADDISKININKIKILGIFNDVRGGHSCGLSIDGDIILGTYKEKLFKDFISNSYISEPLEIPTVIGHTRMATGGAHTEDNAHPFGFGENDSYYRFIGAHNGTLINHKELAKLYNINTEAPSPTSHNKKATRNKIDSEIFLEIIYKKGFKVLEEYDGAAALSFYDTKEPNVIYLYHGLSKLTKNSVESTEERPLFYLQEDDNVFYYSSIKDSLEAINDNNKVIKEFEHNKVYKIKNGNVESAIKYKINRNNCYQKDYTYTGTHKTNVIDYSKKEWCKTTRTWVDKVSNNTKKEVKEINLNDLSQRRINFETNNMVKDQVYFEELRFWKNKTLLEGIYVLDEDSKLQFVCHSDSVFDEVYKSSDDINKRDGEPIKFYFFNGAMLRSEKDYLPAKNLGLSMRADQLSHVSIYPVRSLEYSRALAFFRGNIANLTFTTLFNNDVITINGGECKSIRKKEQSFNDNKKYYLPEDLELVDKLLNQSSEKETEESDEAKVLDIYNENIIATLDYCTDDVEDSIDNLLTQSKIKSKLEDIKQFVIKTLNL